MIERKRILAKKGLCFNCATKPHRASDWTSKSACGHCKRRHHTSICDLKNEKNDDNVDASKYGVSAAVYAVIKQENGTTQCFVCSESRIVQKTFAIPRLELVAGHMTVNLVSNVERAIGSEKVRESHCWLDSTVALYWINGQGGYR